MFNPLQLNRDCSLTMIGTVETYYDFFSVRYIDAPHLSGEPRAYGNTTVAVPRCIINRRPERIPQEARPLKIQIIQSRWPAWLR
jgi:hypothetical protein